MSLFLATAYAQERRQGRPQGGFQGKFQAKQRGRGRIEIFDEVLLLIGADQLWGAPAFTTASSTALLPST